MHSFFDSAQESKQFVTFCCLISDFRAPLIVYVFLMCVSSSYTFSRFEWISDVKLCATPTLICKWFIERNISVPILIYTHVDIGCLFLFHFPPKWISPALLPSVCVALYFARRFKLFRPLFGAYNISVGILIYSHNKLKSNQTRYTLSISNSRMFQRQFIDSFWNGNCRNIGICYSPWIHMLCLRCTGQIEYRPLLLRLDPQLKCFLLLQ